jgi:hypothetical protein
MEKIFVTLALSGLLGTTLLNGQINLGPNNSITGTYSSIAGGDSNKINGSFSIVAGGQKNTNTADFTSIGGGLKNQAPAQFGTIPGGRQAIARSYGQLAYASGNLSATGDAQMGTYVLRCITTSATEGELFLDNAGQRITVPAGGSFLVDVDLVGRGTTLQNYGYGNFYHIRLGVENYGGILNVLPLITDFNLPKYSAPITCDMSEWESHQTWDYRLASTGNSLRLLVTGGAETVYWVAVVRTVEVVKP